TLIEGRLRRLGGRDDGLCRPLGRRRGRRDGLAGGGGRFGLGRGGLSERRRSPQGGRRAKGGWNEAKCRFGCLETALWHAKISPNQPARIPRPDREGADRVLPKRSDMPTAPRVVLYFVGAGSAKVHGAGQGICP